MDIRNVSPVDEKMIVQLIDSLKVLKTPSGVSIDQLCKIVDSSRWLGQLAQRMAEALKAAAAEKPALPVQPKEKLSIVTDKGKGKK